MPQVPGREPRDTWESTAEILGETLDHRGAPSLPLLAKDDVLSHLPVEVKHLAIDRERGPGLSLEDADPDLLEELGIALR
jgi:hypothetical protein